MLQGWIPSSAAFSICWESWSYFPILVDLYLFLCKNPGRETKKQTAGSQGLAQAERGAMYDYILPVSYKDIVNIAKRAFNLVNPRLMGHGERVANIMFQIMEAEGGYTPAQMRNLLTLAVLHDIGAYKTEEIDHMVEFETKNVWNHSIYGYLFLNYFSLFKELSRVVLFRHSSWKQLEKRTMCLGL